MAPRSVTSNSTSSSFPSSTEGLSGSSGSGNPGLSCSGVTAARRHPTVLRMVLEALQAGEKRRGTSVAAIKLYILHKYPTVDISRFKYLLKQALATGMRRGLLARPLNSKARGATGSFKLVPKHQRKPQPSRKPTQTVLPTSSMKKGAAEPGEARAPPRLAEALETVPQGGCKAKGTGSQRGSARKGPLKPAGGSSVHGLNGKPKVPGSQGRRGDVGAPGKTSAAAPKARKRAASPTGRKQTVKTAPGPRLKATTAPKVGRPRAGLPSPARGAEDPRRPRPPVKASCLTSSSEPRS